MNKSSLDIIRETVRAACPVFMVSVPDLIWAIIPEGTNNRKYKQQTYYTHTRQRTAMIVQKIGTIKRYLALATQYTHKHRIIRHLASHYRLQLSAYLSFLLLHSYKYPIFFKNSKHYSHNSMDTLRFFIDGCIQIVFLWCGGHTDQTQGRYHFGTQN